MIDPELIRIAAKAGVIGAATYNSLKKDVGRQSDFLLKKPIYEYEMLHKANIGGICGYHYDLALMMNYITN